MGPITDAFAKDEGGAMNIWHSLHINAMVGTNILAGTGLFHIKEKSIGLVTEIKCSKHMVYQGESNG